MDSWKKILRKSGFTLMEVNLAIFIMAAGVLAMVSLYPLGFRESQQSKDDVKAAAAADAVLNQIAGALSERTLTWSDWKSAVESATNMKMGQGTTELDLNKGWGAYSNSANGFTPKKKQDIKREAERVFGALVEHCKPRPSYPLNSDTICAIVATPGYVRIAGRKELAYDWTRVVVSLRVTRHAGALFAQPIYFREIHFQGDQLINESGKK